MRPARRGAMARAFFGAALSLLAGAPMVMAASSSGSNSSGGTSGFVPFHGFPPFTQHSGFIPFTVTTDPKAPFPRGFCCVTAAPTPQIVIQFVETPPAPEHKPPPPPQARIATESGVTVIRGFTAH